MYYLRGFLLGLAMIIPIGPQNLFVINRGMVGGLYQGFVAAAAAGVADTALILAGAAGLSQLLNRLPGLRGFLLVFGALFLTYLGVRALLESLTSVDVVQADDGRATLQYSTRAVVATTFAVSWGNPHAILDTVGVLGTAIAAQAVEHRLAFGAGAVSASWAFFVVLALLGSWVGGRVTTDTHLWIQRISGALLLVFAVLLGIQGWRLVG